MRPVPWQTRASTVGSQKFSTTFVIRHTEYSERCSVRENSIHLFVALDPMPHRIYTYVLSIVGFLVLLGNTAAIPEDAPLVFDLVRIPKPNEGAQRSSRRAQTFSEGASFGKRDTLVAVEQLQQKGNRMGIKLKLNGGTYILNLDTGSTPTWIAHSNFKCFSADQIPISIAKCGIGPDTYKGTFMALDNFRTAYYGGEVASGKIAKETIEIGGKKAKDVQIGFANELTWIGDGLTVGVFGIGWGIDNKERESSVWQKLCAQHKLPMQFTLAINRYQDGEANGGSVAFGSTLDGKPVTPGNGWTTVDAVSLDRGWHVGRFEWAVDVDGAITKEEICEEAIVDSGDTMIRLPKETVNAFLAAWHPDPKWDATPNAWQVDCTAQGPDAVHVEIGGTRFLLPVKHNIMIKGTNGRCYLMIADAGTFSLSLGLPFMRHVIINHDLKERKISFKPKVYTT
ncbi:aspartic peptidase domain-containing protein [Massariosphaeria phaeospora]|uniref:Aspartic peptidase domain-containing protein n=1 Tax=Massariosphaeria phaeospora TaxID=100035 RepID=A0A7C8I206_9PLEO|nr:aspartic peptidase domain-containing protein [Massariosphaeria phaeospora]